VERAPDREPQAPEAVPDGESLTAPPAPAAAVARVLELQRTAGNAAVGRLLARNIIPLRLPQPEAVVAIPGIVVCFGGTVEPILDTEHHWIEIGDESYGWWPSRLADGDEDRILGWTGVPGILNGTTLGRGGTATRDPHHGDAARRFTVTGAARKYGDPDAAAQTAATALRTFALGFSGDYTWNPLGTDCHEFVQLALGSAQLRRGTPVEAPAPAPAG
jgi:hypothetical protein